MYRTKQACLLHAAAAGHGVAGPAGFAMEVTLHTLATIQGGQEQV